MNLTNEDFPATLQAFDLKENEEIFIAEQVVRNQSEIETFTTRYAGKLIKAEKVPQLETNGYRNPVYKKERSSTGLIAIIIIILVIAALVIYGISTGWLQEKLNFKL